MTATDHRHADSTAALQHQLFQVAQEILTLIRVLMPDLTAAQCDAIRTGMRSRTDAPTCRVELRWSGVRCTLVTYVDGAPVVLTELVSAPIPRSPDDEGGA